MFLQTFFYFLLLSKFISQKVILQKIKKFTKDKKENIKKYYKYYYITLQSNVIMNIIGGFEQHNR